MNKKPNILFVLSDQHRNDCVGYNSNSLPIKTPNIDRIAAEGMRFTNAFTPIPICCPARQALLNGRRPETFGALWNFDNGLKTSTLNTDEYSWPRDLNKCGYNNAHVGKWHVNPEHDPLEYGFDDYVNEKDYDQFRTEKYPGIKYVNGFMGEPDPVLVKDSQTHWLAEHALNIIDKYNDLDSPWYIRLDFPQPHLPCRPAGRFAQMYNPSEITAWGSFTDEFCQKPYIQKQQLYSWGIQDYTWEDWAPVAARYFGIISQVDDAIGMVLQKLDELGIADNTIIIYSSDHGDMCGSHRMADKHYVLYDDVVKVPLVIKWPGVINEGSQCDEFVYNCLDLPPTILDMTGLKQKEFFHGKSLMPLLKGQQTDNWRKEVISTYNGQQFGLYTQRMIRNKKWKYIWNTTDIDELYNLEDDPWELNNLINVSEHKETVSKLRKKLYINLMNEGDGLVKSRWMKRQLLENKKL